MIGTTLSHFKITAKLGEGGMGEVYRAEDTKLGRDVAIKVLPEAVASDPERLARFEREAKVLASLNHANIAAIYSFESSERAGASPAPTQDGSEPGTTDVGEGLAPSLHFLVMELVEGEDLKEQLERGALSYEAAQPIAVQIAEALEAAHEKGIIHRDLKPANIKVTPDGQVKVLDFGLAKALDPQDLKTPGPQSLSLSPTLTAQMTQAGVLMGTVAYMSPEQARGQEVDKQADIWAYGVVLFEMLTGRTAFPGDTVTDVMAAVVTQEPDWNTLPPGTPWHVTEVLRLCLAKDPRQRVHDIADSRLMLTSSAAPMTETSPVAEAKTWRRFLPWSVAAALAVIAAGLAILPRSQEAPPGAVQRLSITLPAAAGLAANEVIVLSPDGGKLVMVGYENGARKLLLRRLGSGEIEPIPETEGVDNPFFSPDGASIGFTRDKEMLTMSLETGRATTIAKATWGGGSWGLDNTIVYTPYYTSGLHRIPAAGGDPEELTAPDLEAGELGHFWPQHLPGGSVVLFTAFSVPLTRSSIDAYDLESGTAKTLVEDGVWGRYSPTGHLLFIRDHTLMAVRLDLQKVEIAGAPVPILTDIIPDIGQGDAPLSFAANGTLAYVPGAVMHPPRQLAWVDQNGNETPIGEAQRYGHPRISPDGARIAVTIRDQSWDLWALELDRGTLSRLSFEPATQFGAQWMPDGERIVYGQDDPPYNLYRRTADGTSRPELLVESPLDKEARSISPDGKFLFFSVSGSEAGYDLWLLPLEGNGQPEPWLATPFNEDFGAFSPDGNWVAYQSDETGKNEVYVNRFPDGGRKLQVSIDGGSRPLWSRDGRELYFRAGHRVIAVEVTAGDRMTASRPRELFSGSYMVTTNRQNYDVAADGRFVMIKTPDEDWPREINVVLNWFQELESLVPTD